MYLCAPFIRRSLHFFGKSFLFLFLLLCYLYFGTFQFHVDILFLTDLQQSGYLYAGQQKIRMNSEYETSFVLSTNLKLTPECRTVFSKITESSVSIVITN
jgi:hypothetical protein